MWTYNTTNELYHFGVKGMKWGVRRSKEVQSVNKQYKKDLRALNKERKSGNKSAYSKYKYSRHFMGETYSGTKYYKQKHQNNVNYKNKKKELQEKYEPQFKKAQKQAEKRIAAEKISALKQHKQTSNGKKVAAGVLAGIGAVGVGAGALAFNKVKVGNTGLTAAQWVKASIEVRKA